MSKRTMSQLSYGIERSEDLFEKLSADAAKLTSKPHPHDVFNFVVTAAVLNLYINYGGECYGLSQLREIILQFYDGLLAHIREQSRGQPIEQEGCS